MVTIVPDPMMVIPDPNADVLSWLLVAVCVCAAFVMGLYVRELVWYYRHRHAIRVK
jgi:hypothetical protein